MNNTDTSATLDTIARVIAYELAEMIHEALTEYDAKAWDNARMG